MTSIEHAAFFVDGTELEVARLSGQEAVSTLFKYDVTLLPSRTAPAPADLVGKAATAVIRDSHGGERAVHGIVASAERVAADRDTWSVTVTVRPLAYRLTLGRDSRVFHDRTAVDIVREVLAEAGVPAAFELGGSFAARTYTAQYRESTWAFVSRLCEEEGIFYRFDDAGSEAVVVFCDRSGAAPDLPGGAAIRFVQGSGMNQPTEVIHRLGGAFRHTAAGVSLGSFDPAKPHLKLAAHSASPGGAGAGPQVRDVPGGGPTDPAVLSARAAVQSTATAFQRSQIVGGATSARIVPGRILEVAGHPEPRYGRRYFVTEVTVTARRRLDGEDPSLVPFSMSFRAAPDSAPCAPPRVTPEPVRPGLQSGVVVGPGGSEIHPDDAGRVRVQLHWDRRGQKDERSGKWMRVAQRGTAGSMLVPRVGWTILTVNEEGSPDAPVALSRIFDAEHPPPYPLPEHRTRTVFKTATSPGGGSWNEIRFEDKTGTEEMILHASRDMDIAVGNAKSEQVVADASREVGVDHDLKVGGPAVEVVGQDRRLTISGNETEHVTGGRDKMVAQNEAATVGGPRSVGAKTGSTLSVRGLRKLEVGVAQLDVSAGEIKASAPTMKVLVGGLVLKVAYRDIVEDVGSVVSVSTVAKVMGMSAGAQQVAAMIPGSKNVGGVLQTIGGAKVELSRKARTVLATKSYTEAVGGTMSLTSAAAFSDQAGTEWSLDAKGSFQANGNTLDVVAKERITLKCKGTTITVTKDKVVIHADAIDLSGASMDAATPRLELNV